MKAIIFLLVTFFSAGTLYAQQQVVKHHSYTTYYRPGLKEPDSVAYDLTPAMMNCSPQAPRTDNFQADPNIPGSPPPGDYAVNHGVPRTRWIDLGHLFNALDAACDGPFSDECYYTSNMLPQYQSFNQGDWKKLEIQEQKWAKTQNLRIIAGGIGSLGTLPAGENIPKFMYKAIFRNKHWQAWIMLNDPSSKGHKLDTLSNHVNELNSLTGLHL